MNLNILGKIADDYAIEIPKHFPHIKLHAHVVMPDHVHILLEIFKKPEEKIPAKEKYLTKNGKTEHCSVLGCNKACVEIIEKKESIHLETEQCSVSPPCLDSASLVKNYRHKSGSIPVIIRSYKSICSREIHKLRGQEFFKWQASFYDEVIFDEQYFQNTQYYILTNPKNYLAK
ncbi:MAG: hypothetical protein K9N05_08645 [Candidatus Marinimicrobia bacterium]|nr:hypothetical protein [Candidatus Neomarinimicrobiota bacterium]